ncbi:MAG: hypothetical protein HY815_29535 [Candidatus Riflebacteria bacterium]|nr:hypothetical protein [Candidatus Riflebacteria bacterium]
MNRFVNSRIRVLLVDDSPTTLACLTSALATSDEFVVVGSLTDPEHVLSRVLAGPGRAGAEAVGPGRGRAAHER